MEQVELSIIQKVKNELDISEDKSATDLYDLLFSHRNSMHPDKFLDEERKNTAEEKFKLLSSLLSDLSKFIENERLEKKPSELIVNSKDFEIVQWKQANVNHDEQIKQLKLQLEVANITKKEAEKKFVRLQKETIDKKTEELINHYKPSKGSFIKLTTTFILTLVISVFAQFEKITQVLTKYSPISPQKLNYLFFSILCVIPLVYFKKLYEQNKIDRITKKIKTPFFIDKFFKYLIAQDLKDTFTELLVFNFLSKELRPKNSLLSYIATNIFYLYSDETIDSLKGIFIYNLHVKQFIYITKAENLDRFFKIHNYRQHHFIVDDEDDDDEPTF